MERALSADDSTVDESRSPQEVATRAVVLYGIWRLAHGLPQREVKSWFKRNNVSNALSPDELSFLEADFSNQKLKIRFSWHAERLTVLLWALDYFNILPSDNALSNTNLFSQYIQPASLNAVQEFISKAALRRETDLMIEEERIADVHWQARDCLLNNHTIPDHINIEVVQERHCAINWILGYGGYEWDEVPADT